MQHIARLVSETILPGLLGFCPPQAGPAPSALCRDELVTLFAQELGYDRD
ncbi:hypothetical protein [Oceaniglobus trochenteri]|nr:hypothetical protein [Oceaniglobus trochenteri]